jgi:hypothetical protein
MSEVRRAKLHEMRDLGYPAEHLENDPRFTIIRKELNVELPNYIRHDFDQMAMIDEIADAVNDIIRYLEEKDAE